MGVAQRVVVVVLYGWVGGCSWVVRSPCCVIWRRRRSLLSFVRASRFYPWQGCSKVLSVILALLILMMTHAFSVAFLLYPIYCSIFCATCFEFFHILLLFFCLVSSCCCCWHYVLANLLVKWLSGAKSLTQFFWGPFLFIWFEQGACISGHDSETRTFRSNLYPLAETKFSFEQERQLSRLILVENWIYSLSRLVCK